MERVDLIIYQFSVQKWWQKYVNCCVGKTNLKKCKSETQITAIGMTLNFI